MIREGETHELLSMSGRGFNLKRFICVSLPVSDISAPARHLTLEGLTWRSRKR
jgi:hypothetical protein